MGCGASQSTGVAGSDIAGDTLLSHTNIADSRKHQGQPKKRIWFSVDPEPHGTFICRFCNGKACKHEDWTRQAGYPQSCAIRGLNSSWINSKVLAMQRPSARLITQYNIINQFKAQGIGAVFNLQLPGEHSVCGDGILPCGFSYDPEELMKEGIAVYNFAWVDMGIPPPALMLSCVQLMDYHISVRNERVAVHCHAGYGRTGVAIAAWIMYSRGVRPDPVISAVRARRPPCIQTRPQVRFLHYFHSVLQRLRCAFDPEFTSLINLRSMLSLNTANMYQYSPFPRSPTLSHDTEEGGPSIAQVASHSIDARHVAAAIQASHTLLTSALPSCLKRVHPEGADALVKLAKALLYYTACATTNGVPTSTRVASLASLREERLTAKRMLLMAGSVIQLLEPVWLTSCGTQSFHGAGTKPFSLHDPPRLSQSQFKLTVSSAISAMINLPHGSPLLLTPLSEDMEAVKASSTISSSSSSTPAIQVASLGPQSLFSSPQKKSPETPHPSTSFPPSALNPAMQSPQSNLALTNPGQDCYVYSHALHPSVALPFPSPSSHLSIDPPSPSVSIASWLTTSCSAYSLPSSSTSSLSSTPHPHLLHAPFLAFTDLPSLSSLPITQPTNQILLADSSSPPISSSLLALSQQALAARILIGLRGLRYMCSEFAIAHGSDCPTCCQPRPSLTSSDVPIHPNQPTASVAPTGKAPNPHASTTALTSKILTNTSTSTTTTTTTTTSSSSSSSSSSTTAPGPTHSTTDSASGHVRRGSVTSSVARNRANSTTKRDTRPTPTHLSGQRNSVTTTTSTPTPTTTTSTSKPTSSPPGGAFGSTKHDRPPSLQSTPQPSPPSLQQHSHDKPQPVPMTVTHTSVVLHYLSHLHLLSQFYLLPHSESLSRLSSTNAYSSKLSFVYFLLAHTSPCIHTASRAIASGLERLPLNVPDHSSGKTQNEETNPTTLASMTPVPMSPPLVRASSKHASLSQSTQRNRSGLKESSEADGSQWPFTLTPRGPLSSSNKQIPASTGPLPPRSLLRTSLQTPLLSLISESSSSADKNTAQSHSERRAATNSLNTVTWQTPLGRIRPKTDRRGPDVLSEMIERDEVEISGDEDQEMTKYGEREESGNHGGSSDEERRDRVPLLDDIPERHERKRDCSDGTSGNLPTGTLGLSSSIDDIKWKGTTGQSQTSKRLQKSPLKQSDLRKSGPAAIASVAEFRRWMEEQNSKQEQQHMMESDTLAALTEEPRRTMDVGENAENDPSNNPPKGVTRKEVRRASLDSLNLNLSALSHKTKKALPLSESDGPPDQDAEEQHRPEIDDMHDPNSSLLSSSKATLGIATPVSAKGMDSSSLSTGIGAMDRSAPFQTPSFLAMPAPIGQTPAPIVRTLASTGAMRSPRLRPREAPKLPDADGNVGTIAKSPRGLQPPAFEPSHSAPAPRQAVRFHHQAMPPTPRQVPEAPHSVPTTLLDKKVEVSARTHNGHQTRQPKIKSNIRSNAVMSSPLSSSPSSSPCSTPPLASEKAAPRLHAFLARQRELLHGADYVKFRHTPKILAALVECLYASGHVAAQSRYIRAVANYWSHYLDTRGNATNGSIGPDPSQFHFHSEGWQGRPRRLSGSSLSSIDLGNGKEGDSGDPYTDTDEPTNVVGTTPTAGNEEHRDGKGKRKARHQTEMLPSDLVPLYGGRKHRRKGSGVIDLTGPTSAREHERNQSSVIGATKPKAASHKGRHPRSLSVEGRTGINEEIGGGGGGEGYTQNKHKLSGSHKGNHVKDTPFTITAKLAIALNGPGLDSMSALASMAPLPRNAGADTAEYKLDRDSSDVSDRKDAPPRLSYISQTHKGENGKESLEVTLQSALEYTDAKQNALMSVKMFLRPSAGRNVQSAAPIRKDPNVTTQHVAGSGSAAGQSELQEGSPLSLSLLTAPMCMDMCVTDWCTQFVTGTCLPHTAFLFPYSLTSLCRTPSDLPFPPTQSTLPVQPSPPPTSRTLSMSTGIPSRTPRPSAIGEGKPDLSLRSPPLAHVWTMECEAYVCFLKERINSGDVAILQHCIGWEGSQLQETQAIQVVSNILSSLDNNPPRFLSPLPADTPTGLVVAVGDETDDLDSTEERKGKHSRSASRLAPLPMSTKHSTTYADSRSFEGFTSVSAWSNNTRSGGKVRGMTQDTLSLNLPSTTSHVRPTESPFMTNETSSTSNYPSSSMDAIYNSDPSSYPPVPPPSVVCGPVYFLTLAIDFLDSIDRLITLPQDIELAAFECFIQSRSPLPPPSSGTSHNGMTIDSQEKGEDCPSQDTIDPWYIPPVSFADLVASDGGSSPSFAYLFGTLAQVARLIAFVVFPVAECDGSCDLPPHHVSVGSEADTSADNHADAPTSRRDSNAMDNVSLSAYNTKGLSSTVSTGTDVVSRNIGSPVIGPKREGLRVRRASIIGSVVNRKQPLLSSRSSNSPLLQPMIPLPLTTTTMPPTNATTVTLSSPMLMPTPTRPDVPRANSLSLTSMADLGNPATSDLADGVRPSTPQQSMDALDLEHSSSIVSSTAYSNQPLHPSSSPRPTPFPCTIVQLAPVPLVQPLHYVKVKDCAENCNVKSRITQILKALIFPTSLATEASQQSTTAATSIHPLPSTPSPSASASTSTSVPSTSTTRLPPTCCISSLALSSPRIHALMRLAYALTHHPMLHPAAHASLADALVASAYANLLHSTTQTNPSPLVFSTCPSSTQAPSYSKAEAEPTGVEQILGAWILYWLIEMACVLSPSGVSPI